MISSRDYSLHNGVSGVLWFLIKAVHHKIRPQNFQKSPLIQKNRRIYILIHLPNDLYFIQFIFLQASFKSFRFLDSCVCFSTQWWRIFIRVLWIIQHTEHNLMVFIPFAKMCVQFESFFVGFFCSKLSRKWEINWIFGGDPNELLLHRKFLKCLNERNNQIFILFQNKTSKEFQKF